jgi:hypothetical protein
LSILSPARKKQRFHAIFPSRRHLARRGVLLRDPFAKIPGKTRAATSQPQSPRPHRTPVQRAGAGAQGKGSLNSGAFHALTATITAKGCPMQLSSTFCRMQETHQRDRAANATLENVRAVADRAASAWRIEAHAAERRETSREQTRLIAQMLALQNEREPSDEDRLLSENPDRGFENS